LLVIGNVSVNIPQTIFASKRVNGNGARMLQRAFCGGLR